MRLRRAGRRWLGAMLLILLGARLAWAEEPPVAIASPATPEEASERAPEISIGGRLEALSAETEQLHAMMAAQMLLLQRSMANLEERLSASEPTSAPDPSNAPNRALPTECQRDLAELTARLQQQQLALDEAQRRAEKAEKLAAAMDEAEAQAATEIERLNTELTNAKARQTQALQHTVELERRLATAEARLARFTTEPAPVAPEEQTSAPPAPVLYVVRPADTLSRISERVYGEHNAWPRIYEANRDLLRTPDALSPGMSLVIP